MKQTTLLGVTYPGLPMFRSLALHLVNLERTKGRDAAQRSLDAHNAIQTAFGGEPIDLASQFTPFPNSMATQCPSALAALEGQIEPARMVCTERERIGREA